MDYKIPYDFVLQYLYPTRLTTRKFLKGYALLLNKKVLLYLRDMDKQPEYNGVYIATLPSYFDALQNEIHSSKMEFDLDGSEHSWIFLSEDLPDFNEKVKKACELIKNGDERIGK
ncbi:MAG: hypothetical protein JWQ96_2946 [Segetibacter sp.]|nr:hypothetical protein [Segetibacter sp.]